MMWRIISLLVFLLLALTAVPAIRHLREVPPPLPPSVRLSFAPPRDVELGSGDDVLDAAVSADGRQMAFVASIAGRAQLWIRPFDSDRADPLGGTDGASSPAWKPGGRTIAFFAGGRLKAISLADGMVSDLAGAPVPAGAAWLSDGSLLFVPDARGPVRRLHAGLVEDATRLGPEDRGHAFPALVATGGFVYVATRRDGSRVVRLTLNGQEVELATTSGHAEMENGHLLYVRDGVLLAQALDAERHVLTGRPTPLGLNVGVSPAGRAFFAASPRVLVWAAASPRAGELAWFDLTGRGLGAVAEPGEYWQVRLAPDDRRAAVTAVEPNLRTLDVFVVALDPGGSTQRLTLALAADSDPVWSPDGSRVLFRSMQNGTADLFVRRIGNIEAKEEPVLRSNLEKTASDWRGNSILFQAPGAQAAIDLWTLDLMTGTQTQLTRSGFNKRDARWSPDGRRIAYASDESGKSDIYIEPWPRTGTRTRVSFAGGTRPEWSRDGRAIFFIRGGDLMQARLTDGGAAAGVVTPTPISGMTGLRDYAVARRSDRVLALTSAAPMRGRTANVDIDWLALTQH